MFIFRNSLKIWLKLLSMWAIKKHKIQLVVVSGWYGTELTRELVYNILDTKFTVRRIVNNPWWDLSIPLAILGYADKQRSILGWQFLLCRAFLRLSLGRPNPHTLVLNLNYSDQETTEYWSGFIHPDILLITSFKERLGILKKVVRNTVARDGTIIYDIKDQKEIGKLLGSYEHIFTFGEDGLADLTYHALPNSGMEFKYLGQNYHLQKSLLFNIKGEMLAGAMAIAAVKNVPLLDALFEITKYPVPEKMLNKLKLDLLT